MDDTSIIAPTAGEQAKERRFHFDRRADKIAAEIAAGGDADELISTKRLATDTDTSEQFWEILRSSGGGPPFVVLGPRRIRYSRRSLREWFEERSFRSTAEYINPAVPRMGRKRGSRIVEGRVIAPGGAGDDAA